MYYKNSALYWIIKSDCLFLVSLNQTTMRIAISLLICLSTISILQAQYSGGGEANPGLVTNRESLQKFKDMRFGMFIHWGPVSLRGEEISWSRGREITKSEYDQLYTEFNPELFDARQWVGLARAAGMKYLIITSRHHDGFSLWDSEYTEYDMAATPYGKGILKELAEECKKQGIRFGTYYSICDWYRDDYPVDYPAPDYSFREEKELDAATMAQMDQYITFMKNQLRELIEDYNSFLIWFDGEWEWAWNHENCHQPANLPFYHKYTSGPVFGRWRSQSRTGHQPGVPAKVQRYALWHVYSLGTRITAGRRDFLVTGQGNYQK